MNTDKIILGDDADAWKWGFEKLSGLSQQKIDPTEYKLLAKLSRLGF